MKLSKTPMNIYQSLSFTLEEFNEDKISDTDRLKTNRKYLHKNQNHLHVPIFFNFLNSWGQPGLDQNPRILLRQNRFADQFLRKS